MSMNQTYLNLYPIINTYAFGFTLYKLRTTWHFHYTEPVPITYYTSVIPSSGKYCQSLISFYMPYPWGSSLVWSSSPINKKVINVLPYHNIYTLFRHPDVFVVTAFYPLYNSTPKIFFRESHRSRLNLHDYLNSTNHT